MGQQHGLDVGVAPADNAGNRSDIHAVTGRYPAVVGMDFGEFPTSWSQSVDEHAATMAAVIKKADRLGALFTASSHFPNPATHGNVNDLSTVPDLDEFAPGKKYEADWYRFMNTITATARAAVRDDGTPIPWVFRPFHEHNANWFWWGVPNQSSAKVKAAFRRVHDHLVAAGVRDRVLLAYAPNGDFGGGRDLNRYLSDWPGNDVIDVLGYDAYWQAKEQSSADWMALVAGDMRMLSRHAAGLGKVAALTEYGRLGSHALTKTSKETFQTPLSRILAGTGTAYAMTWASFWSEPTDIQQLPYPGHPEVDDMKNAQWLLAPVSLNGNAAGGMQNALAQIAATRSGAVSKSSGAVPSAPAVPAAVPTGSAAGQAAGAAIAHLAAGAGSAPAAADSAGQPKNAAQPAGQQLTTPAQTANQSNSTAEAGSLKNNGGSATTAHARRQQGNLLDLAQNHYTLEEIRNRIDQTAAEGRYLLLNLSDNRNYALESSLLGQTTANAVQDSRGGYISPRTGGRFYSHEQLREIAQYARSKNVEIIPQLSAPSDTGAITVLLAATQPESAARLFDGQGRLNADSTEGRKLIQTLAGEILDDTAESRRFSLKTGSRSDDGESRRFADDLSANLRLRGVELTVF